MEWIKLIGVAIIVIGFLLRLDTIAVVVVAGLATALVSGISVMDFFSMLGEAFVKNRVVSIFLLTLSMVGISERFGLKEQAVRLIKKMKGLTVGRFFTLYVLIRLVAGFFGIRIGGHPQFVRPIVDPMAQGAAKARFGKIDAADEERLKAWSAASENYGNFFGQNTFVAAAGVLLIAQTLASYGVTSASIAKISVLIAIATLVVVSMYHAILDLYLERKYKPKTSGKKEEKDASDC